MEHVIAFFILTTLLGLSGVVIALLGWWGEGLKDVMIPVRIDCPECGTPHVDEDEWATRPHRTHQCQQCGHEWRPYPVATVGIAPSAEVEEARNETE